MPLLRKSGNVRKTLANLETALTADVQQARILVAELYGKIDVVADGENVWAEYNNAAEKLLIASSGMSLKLGAGAGFVRYLPCRIS